VSIPQQPWRSSPQFSRLTSPLFSTPPTSTPAEIFGHFVRNFVQFYAFFSEFWKLAVRDNHTKEDETQLSERSERENF